MTLAWLRIYACLLISFPAGGQSLHDSISPVMVEETVQYLASNKWRGRVNYSREQLGAAAFLKEKFSAYGLTPFAGLSSFYLPFRTGTAKEKKPVQVLVNDKEIHDSSYYFFSSTPVATPAVTADFFILQAFPPLPDSLLFTCWGRNEKVLVWVMLSDTVAFSEATVNLIIPPGMPAADILIWGSRHEPSGLKVKPSKKLQGNTLYNIAGMLPGKDRPDEVIIFSAHYDHVDHGLDMVAGEIFNGANDNASGTAAVLALAKYFSMRADNSRTLLFCLFAGEELGLLGSRAFTGMVNKEAVKAVINIEMIGMTNASGKNACMVTGPSYSDLTEILQKNLAGGDFRILPLTSDPQRLFERSDNFPFYQEGIPSHTLMCSDDEEPCYHRPCDDARRIDFENMTRVIQAIARSTHSLVAGKDTPQLRKKIK